MYILRTGLFTKPKFYDLLDLILHAAVIAGILLLMLGHNVDGPLCGEHFDGSIPHNLSHIANGYSQHDSVISGIQPPSSWSESFLECFLVFFPGFFLALARWLKLLIIYISVGIWSGLTNPSEAGICSQVPAGWFVLQEPRCGSICVHECPWKCNFYLTWK